MDSQPSLLRESRQRYNPTAKWVRLIPLLVLVFNISARQAVFGAPIPSVRRDSPGETTTTMASSWFKSKRDNSAAQASRPNPVQSKRGQQTGTGTYWKDTGASHWEGSSGHEEEGHQTTTGDDSDAEHGQTPHKKKRSVSKEEKAWRKSFQKRSLISTQEEEVMTSKALPRAAATGTGTYWKDTGASHWEGSSGHEEEGHQTTTGDDSDAEHGQTPHKKKRSVSKEETAWRKSFRKRSLTSSQEPAEAQVVTRTIEPTRADRRRSTMKRRQGDDGNPDDEEGVLEGDDESDLDPVKGKKKAPDVNSALPPKKCTQTTDEALCEEKLMFNVQ